MNHNSANVAVQSSCAHLFTECLGVIEQSSKYKFLKHLKRSIRPFGNHLVLRQSDTLDSMKLALMDATGTKDAVAENTSMQRPKLAGVNGKGNTDTGDSNQEPEPGHGHDGNDDGAANAKVKAESATGQIQAG